MLLPSIFQRAVSTASTTISVGNRPESDRAALRQQPVRNSVGPAPYFPRRDHRGRNGGHRRPLGIFDQAGQLRDMVQNHLLQLLCLIAMDPPSNLTADSIRDEK